MSNSSVPPVAAFDVDGTLTTRDCVVPFLFEVAGRARLCVAMAAQPAKLGRGLWRRDRDVVKQVAVRAAFRGRQVSAVEGVGSSFAETILAGWLRSDTRRRLDWHQSAGHKVVLVSASLGTYLRPLGEMLGVDAVLCTEAEVGEDGRYTGELIGRNCRGAEKLERFTAWLAAEHLAGADTWAYGDSNGDRELLAAARHQLYVKDVEVTAEPAMQR